jgi:predicted metalloprotease with PDZ domain
MDLEILNSTNGEKSLDDVMKAMYDEYYTKLRRGYTDAEFKSMVEKVSGKSFDAIYKDYVNGTKAIDYNKILGYAGFSVENTAAQKNTPFLGVTAANKDGKITVSKVSRNSSAWIGGINVNDEIIGIDGYRVTDLEKAIAQKRVGNKISVLVSRDGVLKDIELELIRDPAVKYKIIPVESPTAQQLKVRSKWLHLENVDKSS